MKVSTIFLSPMTRLLLLLAAGVGAFAVMAMLALQPAEGWTWAPTQWRAPVEAGGQTWVSLGVGLLAFLISAWVWALKPLNGATALFAASGLMTLLFCFAAIGMDPAIHLSDEGRFWALLINMLGASGFGIIMICLFLAYPSPTPAWRISAPLVAIGFSAWTLLRTFGPFQSFGDVQNITFVEMLFIVLAIAMQIWISRKDPPRRAIAVWLGATTLLGAGGFIATVATPITFGYPALIPEQYAFSFFLVIYIGLAVGLLRFRLFDLGSWAYRLVFYASAALVLILVDLALISVFVVEPGPALGLSLLIVSLGYLPMRDLLWRVLIRGRPQAESNLFQKVLDAALRPSGPERSRAWRDLLQEHFRPLEVAELVESPDDVRIRDEGLALTIPAATNAPALELQYPDRGRRLFTPRDVTTVRELRSMMAYAEESRAAYDRGVSEERTRIARDIHDNIGAQLLRALHSQGPDRKNLMIRDTLADLRDVINNARDPHLPVEDILADLRAETSERLEPHGVTLEWRTEGATGANLGPAHFHALRSCVREAASNIIKHAGASRMEVLVAFTNERLSLDIADNGSGFRADATSPGHGLGNMRARIEGLAGDFHLEATGDGTRISATIPVAEKAL